VIGLPCGLVDQVPDGVVDEQETVEFLPGSVSARRRPKVPQESKDAAAPSLTR
jgi:hypothetical protein